MESDPFLVSPQQEDPCEAAQDSVPELHALSKSSPSGT